MFWPHKLFSSHPLTLLLLFPILKIILLKESNKCSSPKTFSVLSIRRSVVCGSNSVFLFSYWINVSYWFKDDVLLLKISTVFSNKMELKLNNTNFMANCNSVVLMASNFNIKIRISFKKQSAMNEDIIWNLMWLYQSTEAYFYLGAY